MKIGLLTYYGDLNFGTNLQAYATLRAVRSIYPNDEVSIIPLHTFWLRIIPYKSLAPASIWRDFVRIRKYDKFKKKYLGITGKDPHFRSHQLALDYIKSLNYDRIYIGADTLLELDRLKPDYDGISCYWLKDVPADKFVIAASAKSAQFDNLLSKQQEELKTAAAQMKMIAVRDRSTYTLFSHLVDESRIEVIPDPTFTSCIDYAECEAYLKKKKINLPPKSVYINCASGDEWLSPVVEVLKDNGYKVVTPRPMPWTDLSLNDLGPVEQSGIYKYFDFVITHRFHEGVFCLKNHTPFLVYALSGFTTRNGESKQVSLLKDFGLFPQGYLGDCDYGIDTSNILKKIEALKSVFDINKIDMQIAQNADRYMDYLRRTENLNY